MTGGFIELCRTRRSVRRYRDRPVEREKLEHCLEAARLAPSAENGQPWRFIVFDDPARKQAVADRVFGGAYRVTRPLAAAPVLVALFIKESLFINRLGGAVQRIPLQFVDAAIAGEHFVLAAAEQGLGTCWIGWFDGRALCRHLRLGRSWRPVALFSIGYPAEDWEPRPPKRKRFEEVVGWNHPPDAP